MACRQGSGVSFVMHRALLATYLCCPLDHAYHLQVEEACWDGSELLSGLLRCRNCQHAYPVIHGVPHLKPVGEVEDPEIRRAKEREANGRDSDAAIYDANMGSYTTAVEMPAILRSLRVQPTDVVLDIGA